MVSFTATRGLRHRALMVVATVAMLLAIVPVETVAASSIAIANLTPAPNSTIQAGVETTIAANINSDTPVTQIQMFLDGQSTSFESGGPSANLVSIFTGRVLSAGSHTVRVTATNSAGERADVSWSFTASTQPATSTTWFFAEGSTQPPFDTWFLIQNPTSQAATVTFTFFLQPSGTTTRVFSVGPTSRFSVFANQQIPNVAFSTRIDSNVPVFAERAVFVSYDGDDVTGIRGPNTLWLFAEGSTQSPFQTWLLLQNPNAVPATATIIYLLENGQTRTQVQPLAPNSRTSIFVNQVLPNAGFSTRVQSDQPIVVERAQFRFPGNAALAKAGVNAPAANWFFAEGRTTFRGLRADTFLLLQNPNSTNATATITLFGTNGATTTFTVGLLPTSRRTIFLNPFMAGSFGIRVNANAPIIAERSIFFGIDPNLGAYSAVGSTALTTGWNLAEGETRAPFDEVISILNPNDATMSVHIDFQLATGQVIGRDFSIGPNRKLEVPVDNILSGANSARVTTSLPSVVERTMYIFKGGLIGAHNTVGFPNP